MRPFPVPLALAIAATMVLGAISISAPALVHATDQKPASTTRPLPAAPTERHETQSQQSPATPICGRDALDTNDEGERSKPYMGMSGRGDRRVLVGIVEGTLSGSHLLRPR